MLWLKKPRSFYLVASPPASLFRCHRCLVAGRGMWARGRPSASRKTHLFGLLCCQELALWLHVAARRLENVEEVRAEEGEEADFCRPAVSAPQRCVCVSLKLKKWQIQKGENNNYYLFCRSVTGFFCCCHCFRCSSGFLNSWWERKILLSRICYELEFCPVIRARPFRGSWRWFREVAFSIVLHG